MLEVLIALLVISIGLIGLALLHLNALQSAHSSWYRSLAPAVALDFQERLWQQASQSPVAGGSCLNEADVNAAAAALQSEWNVTGADPAAHPAGLPGLIVEAGQARLEQRPRPGPGAAGQWLDRWVEVPVTLTWDESRFAGDSRERFDYVIRVNCISEWQPGGGT